MTTMDPGPQHNYRGSRTNGLVDSAGSGRRAHHGNKRWVADGVAGRGGTTTPHAGSDSERWERGGHRGGGRGRGRGGRGKFGNTSVTFRRNGALDGGAAGSEGEHGEMEEEHEPDDPDLNELEVPEEREKFWQELVKARGAERKKAIADGKMDDPLKPKRLEDAITMVGTCVDMCPRFERYRRERENNLFEWETISGTKRVDHKRAVKAYERAAGDKTLPSDLRPPDVLKRTLDYLFHELLPFGGFSETFDFIRDRSRAVRNDFTMQHEMGPVAIECHDRCARFHILALHIERDHPRFSIAMEEQQLMNTLQSLKEFYQDQRGHYQSPTELEMRVYHRLVHIRDQKERHDDIPRPLLEHPVFELTTKFRARVQAKSAPITKTSSLVVDAEAMHIFAELADVLRREGNIIMTYLVACILERHFGKDTIENIEAIRSGLSLSDVIDGYSGMGTREQDTDVDISGMDETDVQADPLKSPRLLQPSGTQWLTDTFGPQPTRSAFFKPDVIDPPSHHSVVPVQSAFSNLKTIPNAFSTASFGVQAALTGAASAAAATSVFGPIRDNNAQASGSLSHKAADSGTVVGLPIPPSASSISPFGPAPAVPQTTMFMSQAQQPSQIVTSFSPQPAQANGFGFAIPPKASFGAETLTSTLNPLVPAFIPTSNLTSAGGSGVATSPLDVTMSTGSLSSTENRKFDALTSTLNEPSAPIFQQLPQEQPTSDITVSGAPLVSSPPSMDFAPLDGIVGQPPSLGRRQPISLPPTPTATVFTPPSLPTTRKSIFGSLKNLQTTPLSAAPTEILSPLVLHSPTTKSLFSIPSLSRRESVQSPLKAVISAADVDAQAEPSAEKLNASLVSRSSPTKKPSLDIMKATALHFARRGWLVKQTFSKWRQRLGDHAKWVEACRRSTLYKERVQAERLSRSVGNSSSANSRTRRRASSESRTPLKKRLRDRLSGEYQPPANDEELARRFEKNHEEHARRWARGSFLDVLRTFLESTRSPLPDNWSAWLSLNQESDGTAIWLEQKFNVPDSGKWKNEYVFQIPILKDIVESASSYPGVIIFERTPLTGVTDLLGRKYRVLEDCTRLRETIEVLPADRHYVPSLLCIAWSERDPDSSKDFDDMAGSLVGGGILASAHEFLISTAALDTETRLDKLLRAIPFDLEGRLVKRVSLNDLFDIWEHQWEEMTKWLGDYAVYGEFDWDRYAMLLEGSARLLIRIIDCVIALLRGDGSLSGISPLRLGRGMDSDKTFDAVLDWLQTLPETDFAALLTSDVRAHQDLGRDFPAVTFLSQMYVLARPVAAHIAGIRPDTVHLVPRTRFDDASKEVEALRTPLEAEMKAYHVAKPKPSKRLASFVELSLDSSRASTPRPKKQRLSLSDDPTTDEETASLSPPSPSLSIATSVLSEPACHAIVTPAMLRSLTRDIRAKYGGAQN